MYIFFKSQYNEYKFTQHTFITLKKLQTNVLQFCATGHGHNESETHDNFNITQEFNNFFHFWDGMKIIIHSRGRHLA
jgi:hypothetical protein